MREASRKPALPDASTGRWRLRRGYLLAVLVLVASLMVVALYARSAREREEMIAETEHVAAAERLATALQERLLRYELAVRGGASLFASVARPTERQWQAYVDGLNPQTQFPGVMGLGYAPYLHSEGLKTLQLEMREGGSGLFALRPAGVREFYGPILYLEPRTMANREAVGYDMFSEPRRQAAMATARDTGQVRLTEPVELLQLIDQPHSTGLLMYAPIYAGGLTPATVAARRGAMSGWVYVPFAVDSYVAGVTGGVPTSFALRIVDVTAGSLLVYQDARYTDTVDPDIWRHSVERSIYGRTWRVDFEELSPASGGRLDDLQATLLAGVLVSLLLFAVVLSLAHTQTRAERIAAGMSESWRRSELRFRSAMEYSVAGIALLDRASRIVEANPALEALFDAAPGSLAGTPLAPRFLNSDAHWDRERDRMVAEYGAYRTTRRLLRGDGDIRQLMLVFSPVPGETDSGAAWLVQAEDITDRLRAEEQVRAMNRLLEARVAQRTRELTQANRELEAFAYSVSHDLRAPLRSVEGFARVLGERHAAALGEDGRGYLSRIRGAARRMDALIDALLKMSRISREELRFVELDMSRIAGEIVAELRQAEPGREVEVWVEAGLRAAGDAALVRNLLQNLIGNAWKFSRETVAARIEFGGIGAGTSTDHDTGGDGHDRQMSGFYVRDNGAGFDPDYAGKLFRPFQRLHDADRFAGNGIGLATVKRIVERHGGTIEAEGRPGQGATFRFTLPAAEVAEDAPATT
jgi:PAS domain S-box-containing protein